MLSDCKLQPCSYIDEMKTVLWETHMVVFDCIERGILETFGRFVFISSRGQATLHLTVLVGRSVGKLQIFLVCERFMHHGPCPTVRDCLAVYPALFFYNFG